ncbi:MAG: glutamate--tRNA ligase [Acidimicrobiia bacterium]|nr:glutamate--tRNA ligase [Acidimicrobiia bacterium]
MTVRVRIAPSPTGHLHVGNARAALFNWLFARRRGGTFIVRIDDTDTERSTAEFEEGILSAMRWLGLDWDEGVEVGGPHGSYRQSDRFGRYGSVSDDLVARRLAYPCFCTPDELDERRKAAQAAGRPPGYDGTCRSIAPSDAAARRAAGEVASIRLAIPRPGVTEFEDLVRDDMRFDHDTVDDFVLVRSSGVPTYHLASTVDDVDYEITHVVRGEDLLPSTPKHILITEAMGATPPVYAHLPLLFGPDGKKLSKRHGDTSVAAYVAAGYLPEALFNYLALLGWSFGGDVTIFSRADAVERFDLSAVSKNPAVFDTDKLLWMNGEYIRALDPDEFATRSRPSLEARLGRPLSDEEFVVYASVAPLVQERVKLLPEVFEMTGWLFADVDYDESSWAKVMLAESVPSVLLEATGRLEALSTWDAGSIEGALRSVLEDLELGARKGFQPVRVAVTGSTISPPLFESMAALGKEATLSRLSGAAARLAG